MSIPVSDAELERLAILGEELGEVQQAIGKILRFGWKCGIYDNRKNLEAELGHVTNSMRLLIRCGDVDVEKILDYAEDKRQYLIKGRVLKQQHNTVKDFEFVVHKDN